MARALAQGLGRAITATSANRSGEPPARTIAEARAALGEKVKVFVEGGTLTGGAPSTVVRMRSHGMASCCARARSVWIKLKRYFSYRANAIASEGKTWR